MVTETLGEDEKRTGPRSKPGKVQHLVKVEKIYVTFNGNEIAQTWGIPESLQHPKAQGLFVPLLPSQQNVLLIGST